MAPGTSPVPVSLGPRGSDASVTEKWGQAWQGWPGGLSSQSPIPGRRVAVQGGLGPEGQGLEAGLVFLAPLVQNRGLTVVVGIHEMLKF